VGPGHGGGVDLDPDDGQRAGEQLAIGEHDHAAGVEEDRAAAKPGGHRAGVVAPAASAA
jgi:hypothetical protein